MVGDVVGFAAYWIGLVAVVVVILGVTWLLFRAFDSFGRISGGMAKVGCVTLGAGLVLFQRDAASVRAENVGIAAVGAGFCLLMLAGISAFLRE